MALERSLPSESYHPLNENPFELVALTGNAFPTFAMFGIVTVPPESDSIKGSSNGDKLVMAGVIVNGAKERWAVISVEEFMTTVVFWLFELETLPNQCANT